MLNERQLKIVDLLEQYSFTRPIADHVFENYDKVLKIDGELGEKKFYDPNSGYADGGE